MTEAASEDAGYQDGEVFHAEGLQMKVLVTGGAGFVGSWIVHKMLERGHDVLTLDRMSSGLRHNLHKDSRTVKIDLCCGSALTYLKQQRFDVVFHCAAYRDQPGSRSYRDSALNNIVATSTIVDSIKSVGGKLVFISSIATYGPCREATEEHPQRPTDPYGLSKLYCEQAIIQSGVPYCILRPSNLFGKRQNAGDRPGNVIAKWMNQLLECRPISIRSHGECVRLFTYIGSVIGQICNAADHSGVFNIGHGRAICVRELAREVIAACNVTESRIEHEDSCSPPQELKEATLDCTKAREVLGAPENYSWRGAITEMWDWCSDLSQKRGSLA